MDSFSCHVQLHFSTDVSPSRGFQTYLCLHSGAPKPSVLKFLAGLSRIVFASAHQTGWYGRHFVREAAYSRLISPLPFYIAAPERRFDFLLEYALVFSIIGFVIKQIVSLATTCFFVFSLVQRRFS